MGARPVGARPPAASTAGALLRRQIAWREENFPAIERGGGQGLESFPYLLPSHRWPLNFYPGLLERLAGDRHIADLPAAANMMNPRVMVLFSRRTGMEGLGRSIAPFRSETGFGIASPFARCSVLSRRGGPLGGAACAS